MKMKKNENKVSYCEVLKYMWNKKQQKSQVYKLTIILK